MKISVLILILTFSITSLYSQVSEEKKFNLSFEYLNPSSNLPQSWSLIQNSDYRYSIDSLIKSNGRYSLRIEASHKVNPKSSGMALIDIPVDFECKEAELRFKIKLQNIKNGSLNVGLIQMKGFKSIQSNEMADKITTEDLDWTEYSIKAPLNPESETC